MVECCQHLSTDRIQHVAHGDEALYQIFFSFHIFALVNTIKWFFSKLALFRKKIAGGGYLKWIKNLKKWNGILTAKFFVSLHRGHRWLELMEKMHN